MPPRRPTTGRGSAGPSGAGRGRPRTPTPRTPGAKSAGAARPAAAKPTATRPAAGRASVGRQGSAGKGTGGTAAARATHSRPSRRQPLARPATVLAGVAVVLALLITPQLRDWWVQQRTLHEMRAGIAASQREVDALRTERARWQDPQYVRAEARERLHFVMPGETGFAVTGGPPRTEGSTSTGSDPRAATGRPWFSSLWTSVRAAGDPGTRGTGRLTDQQLIDRQPSGAVPSGEVLVDQGSPDP